MDRSFGQWVKEQRLAVGFTQTKLARHVGCAAITIRKIEANALRPSVQMATLIATALQISEAEQATFVRLARAEERSGPLQLAEQAAHIDIARLDGQIIKGFELNEQIGTGRLGVVYRATQPSVAREVAVKIIWPQLANHAEFIRRFEVDAQTIAGLEHPHIVPLYDYWREPNAAYLITRLIRGGNLATRLTEGPIPIELIKRTMPQIGRALDLAHRRAVIHQGLKPANILVDEENNAYITDFALVKHVDPLIGTNRTQSFQMESLAYLSPEQISGEPVQPQTDIYCLGLILYEMLTGQKPFSAPTPLAYTHRHLNEAVPQFQVDHVGVPNALNDVIQKATAKRPHERYSDVPTFVSALKHAWTTNSVPTITPPSMIDGLGNNTRPEWEALQTRIKVYTHSARPIQLISMGARPSRKKCSPICQTVLTLLDF